MSALSWLGNCFPQCQFEDRRDLERDLIMLYACVGCGIALAVTFIVASFFGFGGKSYANDRFGVGLAFRAIAEVILVAGFVGALVAVAVLNVAPAWYLFGGYALVRGMALGLEVLAS